MGCRGRNQRRRTPPVPEREAGARQQHVERLRGLKQAVDRDAGQSGRRLGRCLNQHAGPRRHAGGETKSGCHAEFARSGRRGISVGGSRREARFAPSRSARAVRAVSSSRRMSLGESRRQLRMADRVAADRGERMGCRAARDRSNPGRVCRRSPPAAGRPGHTARHSTRAGRSRCRPASPGGESRRPRASASDPRSAA